MTDLILGKKVDFSICSGYNNSRVTLIGIGDYLQAIYREGEMKMEKELKHALLAADAETQYDEKVKRLLGNKIILAVDEFQGMAPVDMIPFIEGEPFISVVPVEPGLTNAVTRKLRDCGKSGQRITGMNTELTEIREGLVRFDIIFYVRMKDGISQMIVNLEAQKDAPSGYLLLNRAVYYVCRMISSQKERDFINMNYNDIKKVFSIWICMNMNENSTDYVIWRMKNWQALTLGKAGWTY